MTQRPRTTTVSLRIREDVLERLREIARNAAVERRRDLSYADLIREAVERMYPAEEYADVSPMKEQKPQLLNQ